MSSQHTFQALDGMRGILALLVAVFHLHLLWHFYDSRFLQGSYLAVDFFFVLSGFVITHASLPKLNTLRQGWVFALRRFGRVWPLHAAVLLAFIANESLKLINPQGSIVAPFSPDTPFSLAAIPTNLLLIQALNIHDTPTWNSPAWSISTEFYTYLLFAALAIFARKWLTPLTFAIGLACALALPYLAPTLDVVEDYGFLRCVYGFFTGYLTYRLWQYKPASQTLALPALTELTCVALMVLFTIAAAQTQVSFIAPLVFALAIWIFAHQAGPVSRLLLWRPFQILGVLSYSIYITHALLVLIFKRVLYILERVLDTSFQTQITHYGKTDPQAVFVVGTTWTMDAILVGYLILVLITAAIASYLVEIPARKAINKFARRWEKAESPAQPVRPKLAAS